MHGQRHRAESADGVDHGGAGEIDVAMPKFIVAPSCDIQPPPQTQQPNMG